MNEKNNRAQLKFKKISSFTCEALQTKMCQSIKGFQAHSSFLSISLFNMLCHGLATLCHRWFDLIVISETMATLYNLDSNLGGTLDHNMNK